MANSKAGRKRNNPIKIEDISQRDMDILSLDTKDVMKKYKMEKQGVYDRRFALNKKIKEAGLTLEQVVNKTGQPATPEEPVAAAKKTATKKAPGKKAQAKKAQAKKVQAPKAEPVKEEAPVEHKFEEQREVMVVNKQVPVILKPIEINFDNFSIRLNGVPKKISVNPDTNAIEIDL